MACDKLADEKTVKGAMEALKRNGISAIYVKNGEEAREKVLEMVPKGAEVFTMSSVTLDSIGLPKEINDSGNYDSVRKKLYSMDRKTQGREMRAMGAAPDYAIGSVNAVTEDGKVLIASNTGSQLPAYAYSAGKVIWIVGTQKIVKDMDEGIKRIYDYVLPLESERVKKAYGMPGSNVSKLLIINKEIQPERLSLILVGEKLGF